MVTATAAADAGPDGGPAWWREEPEGPAIRDVPPSPGRACRGTVADMTGAQHVPQAARGTGLDLQLGVWVDAGLISAEQAERIRAAERAGSPAVPAASGRGSLLGEALGYVGGVLVLIGAFTITGRYWPALGTGGRLGLVFGAAVLLLVTGSVAGRRGAVGPAARLRSVTWLLATAAFAAGLVLLGEDVLRASDDGVALLATAGTAVLAGVLWWRAPRPGLLQHAAVVASLAAAAAALAAQLPVDDEAVAGVAVWGVGVVWLLLGWGAVVAARAPAYAFGALVATAGGLLAVGRGWGAVLAVVTVVALVAAGAVLRDLVLLVVGAFAALVTVPAVLGEYFPDTLTAPLALLATGVLLVVAALLVARRRAHPDRATARTGTPGTAVGAAALVVAAVAVTVLVLGLG